MVQRKVVNKLGIQAESSKSHVATEKRSTALKPCYHQHPDGRNKGGGEIKKKMKKSRSFKASDFESLRSPMRRDQLRFKKLSVDVSEGAALQKVSSSSPNYMKSTSSSDARKERLQLQVSPQSQTSDKNKNSRNSNYSKPCSPSGLKPMKVLKKNSSLKPVRPSMKKSCGVALYPKMNSSQATCSSTLKDSKFPAYVELHPGGTESEGTSIMKVCPYTYCSLNGHHHAASPPLKRFLSARRRLLKAQKSMKLRVMSPPQQKKFRERKKEIDTGQMGFDGDPITFDSDSEISPVVEEVCTDFFVEIFAKPREEISESVNNGDARRTFDGDDEPKLDFPESPEVLEEASSDGDIEILPPASSESIESYMEDDDGVAESMFHEPNCKISGENNLGQNSDLIIAEMDVSMTYPEDAEFDQEVDVWDTDNLACWIEADQMEAGYEICIDSYVSKETETNIEKGMDIDESVSDGNDMDCEEEEAPYFENGIDYSTFSDDGSVSVTAHLQGNEDPHELACNPDDSVRAYEESHEEEITYEEDAESFTISFGGSDCEGNDVILDDNNENLEIGEASDAFDGLKHNPSSVFEPESSDHYNESNVLNTKESDTLSETQNGIIHNASITAFVEDVNGDPTETGDENTTNPKEDNGFLSEHDAFGDDAEGGLDHSICATELRYLQYDPEAEQGAVKEDHSSGHQYPDTDSESSELTNELDDGDVLDDQTSEVGSETDHVVITSNYSQEQVLQSADVADVAEKEVEDYPNDSLKIQISELSETSQDTANTDQTNTATEVTDLSSIIPDQSIPPATQCTIEVEPDKRNIEENQDSENDWDKLGYHYIPKSSCFEECDDTEKYRSISSADCIGTGDEMQLESTTMIGAEVTYVAPNIESPEKDETIINAGTNSNKPVPETYSNLKWKTNKVGKRPIENCDQLKKFNPRPPQYLLPEPDTDAEKVDLRHQTMDERKNAEEWMIDYALQQAVTKLEPARKRRVALLVEAFETVMPIPKYEAHLRHTAASFTHARPIQACS